MRDKFFIIFTHYKRIEGQTFPKHQIQIAEIMPSIFTESWGKLWTPWIGDFSFYSMAAKLFYILDQSRGIGIYEPGFSIFPTGLDRYILLNSNYIDGGKSSDILPFFKMCEFTIQAYQALDNQKGLPKGFTGSVNWDSWLDCKSDFRLAFNLLLSQALLPEGATITIPERVFKIRPIKTHPPITGRKDED